jgi:ferredoxin
MLGVVRDERDTGQLRETCMTFVIAEPCIGTKDASCVDVCPVDCIHPTKDEPNFETAEMLYIDPAECIDCGACEPACPVEAIFEEEAVPEPWKAYTQKNAAYYEKK